MFPPPCDVLSSSLTSQRSSGATSVLPFLRVVETLAEGVEIRAYLAPALTRQSDSVSACHDGQEPWSVQRACCPLQGLTTY